MLRVPEPASEMIGPCVGTDRVAEPCTGAGAGASAGAALGTLREPDCALATPAKENSSKTASEYFMV